MTTKPLALILALSVAGTASAQEPPAIPADVSRLALVDAISSTDGDLRGRILDLSDTGLRLLVDKEIRRIPLDAVVRIEMRGDSLKNGALIGGAIGLLGAAVWIAEEGADGAGPAIGSILGWAVIGAGVDALIPGRTTIYRKPPQRQASLSWRVGF